MLLRAPTISGTISHAGVSYTIVNGLVEVADMNAAKEFIGSHGFTVGGPDEERVRTTVKLSREEMISTIKSITESGSYEGKNLITMKADRLAEVFAIVVEEDRVKRTDFERAHRQDDTQRPQPQPGSAAGAFTPIEMPVGRDAQTAWLTDHGVVTGGNLSDEQLAGITKSEVDKANLKLARAAK
jgi:hypothetical protein